MIWVVIAILVVCYLIVVAIHQSSERNAKIAIAQLQNSPEYLKRHKAGMDYIEFCDDFHEKLEQEYKDKLRLLREPGLKKSVKERLQLDIEQSAKERAELKRKFNAKYGESEYNPLTTPPYLQDDLIRQELSRTDEKRAEINQLYAEIRKLQRVKPA